MNNKLWLEAKNICAYKNGYKVVRDLTVNFRERENIIILGPNGSGKSSIIDLINRNIYPIEKQKTSFKIFNKELIDLWELRKKISTVNNEIKQRINPNLKIIDLIISGFHGKYSKLLIDKEEEIKIATELINKLSIENLSNKAYGYLSDGEKQLCLIARALVNKPKVLILDEPSINLDLKSKFYLIDKIKELGRSGISILCVTHDISMISGNYNRVIMIKDREIIADGYPKEILTSKKLNLLFNVKVKLVQNHRNEFDILRL